MFTCVLISTSLCSSACAKDSLWPWNPPGFSHFDSAGTHTQALISGLNVSYWYSMTFPPFYVNSPLLIWLLCVAIFEQDIVWDGGELSESQNEPSGSYLLLLSYSNSFVRHRSTLQPKHLIHCCCWPRGLPSPSASASVSASCSAVEVPLVEELYFEAPFVEELYFEARFHLHLHRQKPKTT